MSRLNPHWHHVVLFLLAGCTGADSPTAPESLGNFGVALLMDGSSDVVGSGSLTFTQQGTTLGVTGALLLTNAAPGGPATAQAFTDGSLVGGTVRFRAAIGAWQFEGTLTDAGQFISGRHTRTAGGTTIAGAWHASRIVKGPGPPPPP